MLGHRGKTWRLFIAGALCLYLAILPGGAKASLALPVSALSNPSGPLAPITSQGPLEAQILGERPSRSPASGLLPVPSADREGETAVRLPGNLELRISFLYDGDRAALRPERPIQSYTLFSYSMDYRLRPNLQVGLSGFLYQPPTDHQLFQRRYGSMIMGLGPGLKYDLGRWSFTFRSQFETSPQRGENLQNWFRVWYAF